MFVRSTKSEHRRVYRNSGRQHANRKKKEMTILFRVTSVNTDRMANTGVGMVKNTIMVDDSIKKETI